MGYFDGVDPYQRIAQDRSEMTLLFRPWQMRTMRWDRMMIMQGRGTATEQLTPHELLSTTRADIEAATTFYTNFVPTGSWTLINRINQRPPSVRVGFPSAGVDDEDDARREKVQRFCAGVLNYLDQKSRANTGFSFFRRLYSAVNNPGKVALRVAVESLENGAIDITVDILDARNFYHDMDPTSLGPRRFLYEFGQTTAATLTLLKRWELIAQEQGFAFRSPNAAIVENTAGNLAGGLYQQWFHGGASANSAFAGRHLISDYYVEEPVFTRDTNDEARESPKLKAREVPDLRYRVWHALMVDERPVFVRETSHLRSPIKVTSINTMDHSLRVLYNSPANTVAIDIDRVYRHAEPWFSVIDDTVRQYQVAKSLEMQAAMFAINPVRMFKSENGQLVIRDDQWLPGSGIPVKPTDVISYVEQNMKGLEVLKDIVATCEKEFEYAFPSVLRGATAFPHESGFLYTQRIDQGKISIAEYVKGAASAIEQMLTEIMNQLREIPGAKISLKGETVDARGRHDAFYEEFKASDMPKSFALDIEMPPMLPENELEAVNIAAQLKAGGFMDMHTILQKVLRDPSASATLEATRMDAVNQSPYVQSLDLVNGLEKTLENLQTAAAIEPDRKKRLMIEKRAARLAARTKSIDAGLFQGNGQAQSQTADAPGVPPQVTPPNAFDPNGGPKGKKIASSVPRGGNPQDRQSQAGAGQAAPNTLNER